MQREIFTYVSSAKAIKATLHKQKMQKTKLRKWHFIFFYIIFLMQQKCPPKSCRNWVRAYFNCPALVEPFKCVNNILLRNVEDKCCRVKKVRPEKAALTLRLAFGWRPSRSKALQLYQQAWLHKWTSWIAIVFILNTYLLNSL